MKIASTIVNDHLQQGYRYSLVEPAGQDFDPLFQAQQSPKKCWILVAGCNGIAVITWSAAQRMTSGKCGAGKQ